MQHNQRADQSELCIRTELMAIGRWIAGQGWCPATGGNFSARLANQHIIMTASGADKGQLNEEDFVCLNSQGETVGNQRRPSAETLLHACLYDLDTTIGAVLHTHSVAATVLSRSGVDELIVQGYEMQKSLAGNLSHDPAITLAILPNSQDMNELAASLKSRWPLQWGFLVRGHGLYVWGNTLGEAKRHLEGIEFLLACELAHKSIRL